MVKRAFSENAKSRERFENVCFATVVTHAVYIEYDDSVITEWRINKRGKTTLPYL